MSPINFVNLTLRQFWFCSQVRWVCGWEHSHHENTVRQCKAERTYSSTTCLLHVKALKYISTSLQFTLILLCLEVKAETVCTTNTLVPVPQHRSSCALEESSRKPCCLPTPWHSFTTFAILFVILLKGYKENSFQIFLILVTSCTPQSSFKDQFHVWLSGSPFNPLLQGFVPYVSRTWVACTEIVSAELVSTLCNMITLMLM